MKIIDMHTHVYPDAIAAKAAQSIRNYYHLGENMDGTIGTLLERGKAAGVEHWLILPVAVKPEHVQSINNFTAQQICDHSCFTGFGTVHADMENMMAEVERIVSLGLKGIKLHPDCQHFNIDDPRLFPVYEMAGEKLPIIFHMGDQRYDYSHPARLRKVLDLFPGLEVIAAHFGGYSMFHTARELLWDTDCVFDISSAMMFMEQGEAERYINGYGAERMAYGTDYPLWDPVEEVARFQQLKLTDDQFDQIAHKTAERILKLK